MSRRSILRQFNTLPSVDSTTNPSSGWTDISGIDSILFRVLVDPAAAGSMTVIASNNLDKSESFSLPFDTELSVDGSTDELYLIRIQNAGLKWVQLEYTDNGGSGDMAAWISGTTVGA